MKKRRINLLSVSFKKRKLSDILGNIQSKGFIFMGVLIIAVIGVFQLDAYFNREIKSFEESKKPLQEFIANNQDFDRNIKYFIYKNNLLDEYLAEDANGYFYYNKISSLVTEFAPAAQIGSFTYDNTGKTKFSVSFQNYEEASTFISAVETPEFLSNFEYVTLSSFDASPQTTVTQTTEIVDNPEATEESNLKNSKDVPKFIVNIDAKLISSSENET